MISVNKSNVLTSNNFGINSFLLDEKELFLPFKKQKLVFENIENQTVENSANFEITNNLFVAKEAPEQKTLFITKSQTKPIYVSLDAKERSYIKLKVVCDENVEAKVVVTFGGDSFLKSELFFDINKNAKLEVILLNDGKNKNFCNIETKQDESGRLLLTVLDFCENISLYNVFSQNKKQKACFNLDFLYAKTKAEQIDINILAENYGKESKTKINVLGMLDGLAQKSFKGIIDFKRGAKQSVGEEKEFALMLSKGVKSKSLPVLLCGEEDVLGVHATSSGKLLDDAIFYITSRGISGVDAKKLLVKAKFNVILSRLFDEKIAKEVSEKIDRSIESGTNWF